MGIVEIITGVVLAIIGLLGFTANRYKNQRDDAVERAESAERETQAANEIASTQSELIKVHNKAQEKQNETLKSRDSTVQPPANLDFNRNRMLDDSAKD